MIYIVQVGFAYKLQLSYIIYKYDYFIFLNLEDNFHKYANTKFHYVHVSKDMYSEIVEFAFAYL